MQKAHFFSVYVWKNMKDGVESKMYAKKRLYLTSLYGHLRFCIEFEL